MVSEADGRPDQRSLELFERLCSGCHRRILWAKTEASDGVEWMPCDADPSEHGNVLVRLDPDDPRRALATVVANRGRRAAMIADGWVFRLPHAASCPKAAQYTRGPKSMRPTPSGVAKVPAPRTPADDELPGLW